MPANPERQRWTALNNTEIAKTVSGIMVNELGVIVKEREANPNHPIKGETIVSFVNNRLGEPRIKKPEPGPGSGQTL